MLKQIKKSDGAIILEASISLTAFMFFIVTILTIINICAIQAKMSYALNATAKEISQYSYLYSLTGLNDSQYKIHEKGNSNTETARKEVNDVLASLNSAYGSLEKLGQKKDDVTAKAKDLEGTAISDINMEEFSNSWNEAIGDVKNIGDNAQKTYDSLKKLTKEDPKKLMFGIAQLAASETFDLAKSRLIAAPVAKIFVQKHLVDEQGGSCEDYLKFMRIVPNDNSYIDGLDFNNSTLFANGSNEIRINVNYDVNVIALLPIDFSFHFNQTAVTHGWLAGDVSFKSAEEYKKNETIWTAPNQSERVDLIRHLVIDEQLSDNPDIEKCRKITDVQLYDKNKNEFTMISSMNPLYVDSNKDPLTVDQLDDKVLKESIEQLCANIKSTTDGETRALIQIKQSDGTYKNSEYDCTNASNRIILVIPQDEGLKDKMESIVKQANTRGVNVQVYAAYGKGTPIEKVEK